MDGCYGGVAWFCGFSLLYVLGIVFGVFCFCAWLILVVLLVAFGFVANCTWWFCEFWFVMVFELWVLSDFRQVAMLLILAGFVGGCFAVAWWFLWFCGLGAVCF